MVVFTNEANRNYFGCDRWTALANAYMMEARRRCLFYLDHGDNNINMFYKTPHTDSSEFIEDDDQDHRDDHIIIIYHNVNSN